MQTMFRATVMLASLAAGLWALNEYGPEDAVRSTVRKGIEFADNMLGRPAGSGDYSFPTVQAAQEMSPADPRQPAGGRPMGSSPLIAANESSEPISAPRLRLDEPPAAEAPRLAQPPTAATSVALNETLRCLDALGATNVTVQQWGRSRTLHRVSCELPVANTSGMTRHFEAVANQPEAAATEVLQQIEAGRPPNYPVASLQ